MSDTEVERLKQQVGELEIEIGGLNVKSDRWRALAVELEAALAYEDANPPWGPNADEVYERVQAARTAIRAMIEAT